MTGLGSLIKRNVKLYFKDKGMFLTSLITPIILLVLYVTFLGTVYESLFRESIASAGVTVADKLIQGCVGSQLISSLLAVSCVTVAFCSNLLMVQDKVTGARRDLMMAPLRRSTLAFSYYLSSLISTLIVCLAATAVCLGYLGCVGWYLSFADVALLVLDVVLLVLFGTALASCVNFFLSSNGQGSAVGTVVSAGYGFICGAYMPISQFTTGLQNVISFLPGTYGTSLLRNHAMGGVFREMSKLGFPSEVIEAIKDSVDANIYFFGNKVSITNAYIVLAAAILIGIGVYLLFSLINRKKKK